MRIHPQKVANRSVARPLADHSIAPPLLNSCNS
jgi:hypothetical protein